MRYIIGVIVALFLLTGCGSVQESFSNQKSFEVGLTDGRTVQCVQVTGSNGSVAVHCDFDNAR